MHSTHFDCISSFNFCCWRGVTVLSSWFISCSPSNSLLCKCIAFEIITAMGVHKISTMNPTWNLIWTYNQYVSPCIDVFHHFFQDMKWARISFAVITSSMSYWWIDTDQLWFIMTRAWVFFFHCTWTCFKEIVFFSKQNIPHHLIVMYFNINLSPLLISCQNCRNFRPISMKCGMCFLLSSHAALALIRRKVKCSSNRMQRNSWSLAQLGFFFNFVFVLKQTHVPS